MESSQTPKPPTISLWRNVLYAWKKLKAVEGPAYFLILGLSLICQVAAPLIGLILPSTIVRLYQANTPWQQMVWSIFLMSFALLLLQLGKVYCQRKTETIPFFLRLDLVPEFLLRSVCRDYQLAESPAGQDGMASAQRAILMGNQFGIEAFLVSVGTAMYQLCGFVVYVFISAQLNVWILAVLLATTAGIALLNHKKQKAGHTYVEDIVPPENRLRRLAGQILDGKYAKDIHLYQMKTWLMGTIDGIRGLTLSIDNRYARKVFLLFLGQQFLILVRDGFVYGYLLYQMVHGAMAAADFILFSGVAAGISTWLSGFAGQLSEMQSNGDLVSHYRLYMDELPSKGKPRDFQGAPVPNPGKAHTLQMEHVYFQYPDTQEYALEDINLTLQAGEKLALVGANGAGKSTLVKLLCGLYHPTKGRILLDGVDISTIQPELYFQEFSVVFQDVFAFAFPLSSNVACQTREKIQPGRLAESLEQAGLTQTISGFPKGAETSLLRILDPDGAELSGGQMQKLMLARALYKNAPVVILDEPTASLDPLAELDMYRQYNRFTEGKTSVFISHRLSSTRFCDRVIFLEAGKITETGTHDSLMKQAGSYAHMFAVQSHYYRKEDADHA